MIPYYKFDDAEGEPPRGWIVPSVVLYVAARGERSNKGAFVRSLKNASRRAGLDRVEARMVLPSHPAAASVGGVCPGLVWLAGQARRAPMPRLLYVARFADLAPERSGFAKTLQLLFDADFSVRVCDGLVTAADRSLEQFRAVDATAAKAPAIRSDRPRPARRTGARSNRGGSQTTLTGEA